MHTAKLSSHCKNDTEVASEATYSICHNRDFMAAGIYTVYSISITKNNCSLAQWHLLFPVHNRQKARCILNVMKTTKFEVYATLNLHKITKYPCVFKNSAPSALNKSIFFFTAQTLVYTAQRSIRRYFGFIVSYF